MPVQLYTSVGDCAVLNQLLADLGLWGWPAGAHFAVASGRYRQDANVWRRWHARIKMLVGYPISAVCRIRGSSASGVRIVTTNPFFAPALLLKAAHKKAGCNITWVLDLYPDALVQAGVLRAGGAVARYLGQATRTVFRQSDAVVYLGPRLQQHAEHQYGAPALSRVIPYGADAAPFRQHAPRLGGICEPVRFLYCGNLGRMHDWRTLAGAIPRLASMAEPGIGPWEVVMHASGPDYKPLKRSLAHAQLEGRMHLDGPLEHRDWVEVMLDAAVAVVTLSQGAERVSMPSKLYSALAAGQAILAVCPAASDLADIVRKHQCGWVVEPGDSENLFEAMRSAVSAPAGLHQKRLNAFRAGHACYSVEAVAREWVRLFEETLERKAATSGGCII